MLDLSPLLFGFSLVDFIFVHFILMMLVTGILFGAVEKYLPAALRQSICYGKFSFKGEADKLVSRLEIPKSWFKHFYVYAAVNATVTAFFVVRVYLLGEKLPNFVDAYLDFVSGPQRSVEVSSTTTVIAAGLITMQCLRRFYETHFVQIFSSKCKINIIHYLVGYLHYFGAITMVVSSAAGFVHRDSYDPPQFSGVSLSDLTFIWLFIYSWFYQFQSNLLLVSLRTNKSGKVVTEKHLMPQGGYFEHVSAPHMLFEILMYVAMWGLLRTNTSLYCMIWVAVNQIHNAAMTHKWYKETFKDYPKKRKAVFPYLL